MQRLRVLVTGGAGFIGSHIVEALLDKGVKYVRVLDNLSTGSLDNLSHVRSNTKLEVMYGDITNIETCRRAVKNIDVICHQAALGSIPRSIDDPLMSHNTNINGFLNIILAAKENGIKRIVYASSSSVYGTNIKPVKEEHESGLPRSPYALTKAVDELYGHVAWYNYDMETIGLRYFNIFGPRQTPNGPYAAVIPLFISKLMKGETPVINGDGSYSRDFTYVSNVVDANILALTTTNRTCFGQVFNIGCNNPISINGLYEVIEKEIGLPHKDPIYRQVRMGDVPHSNASIAKANIRLGYEPKVTFQEGIARTVMSFRQ